MQVVALVGVPLSYNTVVFYSAIRNMCTRLYFQLDLFLLKSVVYRCVCVVTSTVRASACFCLLHCVVDRRVGVFECVFGFVICVFLYFFCVCMVLLSWAFCLLTRLVPCAVQNSKYVYNAVFCISSLISVC